MPMTDPNKQNLYYRRQAAQCAAAALATTIAEIKQAYLDLEQGWHHLLPEQARASVRADRTASKPKQT
jgi:hypothetical protein